MTAHLTTRANELAREACRYLEAVETFASLGADPHAAARARAAQRRRVEERTQPTARKEVRGCTR